MTSPAHRPTEGSEIPTHQKHINFNVDRPKDWVYFASEPIWSKWTFLVFIHITLHLGPISNSLESKWTFLVFIHITLHLGPISNSLESKWTFLVFIHITLHLGPISNSLESIYKKMCLKQKKSQLRPKVAASFRFLLITHIATP